MSFEGTSEALQKAYAAWHKRMIEACQQSGTGDEKAKPAYREQAPWHSVNLAASMASVYRRSAYGTPDNITPDASVDMGNFVHFRDVEKQLSALKSAAFDPTNPHCKEIFASADKSREALSSLRELLNEAMNRKNEADVAYIQNALLPKFYHHHFGKEKDNAESWANDDVVGLRVARGRVMGSRPASSYIHETLEQYLEAYQPPVSEREDAPHQGAVTPQDVRAKKQLQGNIDKTQTGRKILPPRPNQCSTGELIEGIGIIGLGVAATMNTVLRAPAGIDRRPPPHLQGIVRPEKVEPRKNIESSKRGENNAPTTERAP